MYLQKDDDYFRNKRILITGVSGFVGTHLAERLRKMGSKVFGTSRSAKSNGIYAVDILDFEKLEKIIAKNKIDICFHLAAEASVEEGQKDPYTTLKVNVMGTLNVLELARKNNLEKVIITSTSHVYGENILPYIEEYTPKPTRPYETSKTCTDIIAQSYADSFQLPVLIPRFVNIYGPGDRNFNRLVPKTIKSILSGNSPTMWGGGAIRDYLFIDDAVDAYLALARYEVPKMKSNRVFNFGGGNLIDVKDLIEKIIKISGKNISIERIPVERSDEINKQYVSWSKSKKILHWKPNTGLDEGLRNTFEWYKDNLT